MHKLEDLHVMKRSRTSWAVVDPVKREKLGKIFEKFDFGIFTI